MQAKKTGQEEIVGFVVIVILVSVILIIILSIKLQNPQEDKKSAELSSYLRSFKEVTTDCALYGSTYASFGQLLKECYKKRQCLSGENACAVLNTSLRFLLTSTLPYGPEHKRKGYAFKAEYFNNYTSNKEPLLEVRQGNCTGEYTLAENFILEGSGSISYILKECY